MVANATSFGSDLISPPTDILYSVVYYQLIINMNIVIDKHAHSNGLVITQLLSV